MDQVSGGAGDWFYFKGNYVKASDLSAAGQYLLSQFGFDIAAEMLVN